MKRTVIVCALSHALAGCATTPRQAPALAPPPARSGAAAIEAGHLGLGWPVWIGVVCDDLPKQRRFYRDVLGLEERNVREGSSWFVFGNNLLELFAKSARPQHAERGVAFGFAVEDVALARQALLAKGVEPVSEVEGAGGDYWAYFRDAEGNLFEVVQRRP